MPAMVHFECLNLPLYSFLNYYFVEWVLFKMMKGVVAIAKRTNHYDVAFEELLRLLHRPYVAVDETRRALHHDSSLKSMDFIVYAPESQNLLIDVKGRQFPTGKRHWENWTMQDDIDSLLEWQQVFGEGFRSLLVFAYEVLSPREMAHHSITWEFRQRQYAFYGVWVDDYQHSMKTRSRSWKTVSLPSRDFQRVRQPLLEVM